MILILGGTTEGTQVLAKLIDKGQYVTISTAYAYAGSFIPRHELVNHISGRLTLEELIELINENTIKVVIDATHPHATVISENARTACRMTGARYIAIERETATWNAGETIHAVSSSLDAIRKACEIGKIIFCATGSKDAKVFRSEAQRTGRKLYIRILPQEESIEICKQAGFADDEVVTGTGPYNVEDNYELWKRLGIDVLVTKESGRAGGLNEKLDAASKLGIHVVIVQRPPTAAGSSVNEVVEAVLRENGI
ncbi:MAG TPA: precorrin-6A reductase [Candidatus Aquicultor sp.]|jgi:precorrin-6x reductase